MDRPATTDTPPNTDVPPGTDVPPVDAPPAVALIVTPASVSVTEGDDKGASFMVALSRPSSSQITVNVASADRTIAVAMPDIITFDPNNTAGQKITVLGTRDDDVLDNVTNVVLSATGLNPASVRVQVTDVDVQALTVAPTQVSMTEGKTSQFSVRLSFRPSGTVTANVTSSNLGKLSVNPSTLTFNASNFSVPQTITLTAATDSDTMDDTATVTVAATGVATAIPVPVIIVDKDVLRLDVNRSGVSLVEGDTTPEAIFVKLTQRPSGNVTVAVSSSNTLKAKVSPATLTFTPDTFDTDQEVAILSVPDDDTKNDTAVITLSAGGGIPDRTVMVDITDNNSQSIVVSPAAVSVTEGDTVTFNVKLAFNPGAAVAVSVFPSNTSKIDVSPSTLIFDANTFGMNQMVTVKGVQDDDLAQENVKITLTSSGANAVDVPVTVRDDDKQAIQLVYAAFPGDISMEESPATGTVKTTSFGVRLAFRPAASVTVNLASDSPKLTLSPSSLTFTPDEFSMIKLVTATSVHDADLITDTVGVTATSDDKSASLKIQIIDIDVENFSLDPAALAVDEPSETAGTLGAMFNVGLTLPPKDPIKVTVTSSDTARVAVLAGSEAFTLSNNTTPQAVMLSVKHDSDSKDDSVTLTITAENNVIPPRTVTVGIHDTDAMSFLIGGLPTSGDLVVEESPKTSSTSDTATFTVRLSADPVTTRSVTVVPSVAGVLMVTPDMLTFTGGVDGTWQMPQTITIKGKKDENIQDELLNIRISGPTTLGASDAFVTVRQKDVDIQSILLSGDADGTTAPDSPIMVAEGGAGKKFYVRLQFQPSTSVTVNVSLPDGLAGSLALSPSTLTFSTGDYTTRKAVTVLAPEEDPGVLNMDDEAAAITVSLPGQATATVNVASVDNDTGKQAILITDGACSSNCPLITSTTLDESSQHLAAKRKLNVALAYPPRKIDSSGVQILSVTIGSEKVSATPLALTFDNSNGVINRSWNQPQTLTLSGVGDADDADPGIQNNAVTVAPFPGGALTIAPVTLSATISDKDNFLTVDTLAMEASVSLDPGASHTFAIGLDRALGASSMVTAAVSSGSASIDTMALTIADGGTASIKVTAVTSGDSVVTLTSSVAGIPQRHILVHVNTPFLKVDDAVDTDKSVTLESGATQVFSVGLDRALGAASTVAIAINNAVVGISATSLNIAADGGGAALTVMAKTPGDADITLTSSVVGIPARHILIHVNTPKLQIDSTVDADVTVTPALDPTATKILVIGLNHPLGAPSTVGVVSSDDTIVSVDFPNLLITDGGNANLMLTAKAPGDATITLSSSFGGIPERHILVHVNTPKLTIDTMALDVTVNLNPGATQTFAIALDRPLGDASTVAAASSDTDKATVDTASLSIASDGSGASLTVTAAAVGDADITLTSSFGAITARVIHVHVPTPKLKIGTTIGADVNVSVANGDMKTFSIGLDRTVGGATTISAMSSNTGKATVDMASFNIADGGTATLTITGHSASGTADITLTSSFTGVPTQKIHVTLTN